MALVRVVRLAVVASSVAFLMLSGCSWRLTVPIPGDVPPAAGETVPEIDIHLQGQPADQLRDWAAKRATSMRIPARILEGYAYAAKVTEIQNPSCHLSWTTLAGIGMVETRHGTYHGAVVAADGDVSPPIRGGMLDGSGDTMPIADDADGGYARAMGPMQFIPETWRRFGISAHYDGVSSPDNIDDAALTAAHYLCARGGDLQTAEGWLEALWSYNHSTLYAQAVRDWATAYARGHSL